ncbi:MAG TPA: DUF2148 domain-containing protein [Bacteroidales bacterium]|jgi:uncharacterized ferredoxin-like protein|nr:DUF2148 domain-containing protein [Bacteroidales bacterium]MDD4395272.1 DUF2148 domain-containing protein [Bacteroidales bacterium]HNW67474.1 DUF2148 domain-containing protein [Bacteroidales bacterium]HPT52512.1 DUF2148 domain-containing protein [Bacteroidales bacterium]
MIIDERTQRATQIIEAAMRMMTAARTAPKARGIDIIETICLTDNEIDKLSKKMHAMFTVNNMPFFERDAENIKQAGAIVLIGTKSSPMGLNCGYCGHPACAQKPENTPCTFNSIDLGIAIGSATATAADLRVDCRVMFSAGAAAHLLNLLPDCETVIAIPISISSKNPFFDRK